MAFRDSIKQYKLAHWIYNILHYRQLKHNRRAYKQYGIKKPLFSSISSKDFPDKTSRAWLDTGHSRELVTTRAEFNSFPPEIREQLLAWSDDGSVKLRNYFSSERVDAINKEIDKLMAEGKLNFTNGNKLMFANRISPLIKSIANDEGLLKLLGFILDKEVVPFQTINFIKGSNQRAHSDSIHMTTYPLGYLIAAWIALEDTSFENGPLFYYPGSHRLPYLLNNDFNEGESFLSLGKKKYTDYEDVLEDLLVKENFKTETFMAKKGDVFIWHANLVHGGSPILNPNLTRKSMVVHYYARDVIKYHEITERPSLLESE
jgi:hypothetical protein